MQTPVAIKRAFIQALPTDNPYLSPQYVEVLKDSFKHRPELIEAYLHGCWDVFEGARVIIKTTWLREARNITLYPTGVRRVISCDPARFGDDETVIYVFENTCIIDQRIYGQKRLTHTAGQCAELARQYTITGESRDEDYVPVIAVDVDGVGSGVADDLVSWGFDVMEIHSAAASSEPDRYYNLRAQMWWEAGIKYSEGDIDEGEHDDPELDRQLITPQYDFRNGKIIVEEKAEIKDRLKRSPDRADAKIMGLHALKFARTFEEIVGAKRDRWTKKKKARSAWAG